MKATLLSVVLLLSAPLVQAQTAKQPVTQPAASNKAATLGLALAGSKVHTLSWKSLLADPQVTVGTAGYTIAHFNLSLKPIERNELIGPIPNKGGQLNGVALGILKDNPKPVGSRIFIDDIQVITPEGTTETLTGAMSFTLTE